MTASPGPPAWLVLVYRLPATSQLKTVIGRKLTAMGAVYPVNYADAMVREVLERHQVPIACWSVSGDRRRPLQRA